MNALFFGLWMQLGCGDVDESGQSSSPPTEQPSTLPVDPEGHRVYTQYCAACHGPDGRGQPAMDIDLRERHHTAPRSPAELFTIVKHGQAGPAGIMPAWTGTLSDDQIVAVLTYMQQSFTDE